MANQFMSGFDDHDAAGLAYEWIVSGSPSIVAGRTGNCCRCGSSSALIRRTIPSAATMTFGFAYRPAVVAASTTALFGVGDATKTHVILILNADGTLSVYRSGQTAGNLSNSSGTLLATSTATVSAGAWTYIEITITIGSGTAGSVALRFGGSASNDATGSVSGVNTQNAGTATMTWFEFSGASTIANYDVDDVWANDTTGSVCTGFLGDMRVDFHLPDADGANTGWTPSTGATHYGVIDENPQNLTDYNSTATLNAKDTVSVEAFKNDGADIQAIQINLLASKSDAGTCGIQAVVRESGVDTPSGVTTYPSTSWLYLTQNYSLAIGDAKRAAAGFDAAEFGYQKVA